MARDDASLIRTAPSRLPPKLAEALSAGAREEGRRRALEQVFSSSSAEQLSRKERRRALAAALDISQAELDRFGLPESVAQLERAVAAAEDALSGLAFTIPTQALEQLIELISAQVEARLRTTLAVPEKQLLNVKEAAAYIRAKPQRIYDLTSKGKLQPRKDGNRSLFTREQLDAYLEQEAERKELRRQRRRR